MHIGHARQASVLGVQEGAGRVVGVGGGDQGDWLTRVGGPVGGGESVAAVCAGIQGPEVHVRSCSPTPAPTQVKAVHSHEPVGAWYHLHHKGDLEIHHSAVLVAFTFVVSMERKNMWVCIYRYV